MDAPITKPFHVLHLSDTDIEHVLCIFIRIYHVVLNPCQRGYVHATKVESG